MKHMSYYLSITIICYLICDVGLFIWEKSVFCFTSKYSFIHSFSQVLDIQKFRQRSKFLDFSIYNVSTKGRSVIYYMPKCDTQMWVMC